jgi:hypothetical protein
MAGQGFSLEKGHIVPLYTPIDEDTLAGAKSPVICLMGGYEHATIIVSIGQLPRAAGVITVESCADVTPTSVTQLMFRYYRFETSSKLANGDVHAAMQWTTTAAAGLIPVATGAECFYVIELDSEELIQGHVGFRLAIADAANASVQSAIAVLSGPRYADANKTAMAII